MIDLTKEVKDDKSELDKIYYNDVLNANYNDISCIEKI